MNIIIVGGGKTGAYLASLLGDRGDSVKVIESRKSVAEKIGDKLPAGTVLRGVGSSPDVLEQAGVLRADIVIAVTGSDEVNLVVSMLAKMEYGVGRVVARVNNPRNMRIFQELGIESVSSTTLIANLIEEETMAGSMSVMSSLTNGNVSLQEVTLPRMKHHNNEKGVRVSDIPLPTDSLIVAVDTGDDVSVVSPATVLYPGDKAIVAADTSVRDDVRACFRSL